MKLDVMSQVRTAFSSLVSRSDRQGDVGSVGGTGRLGGATVQMASTANQPAHSSGIGARAKAFFAPLTGALQDAKAWLQAKMQPAPTPQVPISQPNADKAGSIGQMKGRVEYAALNDKGKEFKANDANLSPSTRLAITGAYAQLLMDEVSDSSDQRAALGNFMRDNNSISRIAAHAAYTSPKMKSVSMEVRAIIGETPVVLNKKSLGLSTEENGGKPHVPDHPAVAALAKDGGIVDRQAIAKASVETIDRVMVELFGDPDDPASIDAAVSRLPQELCDQFAIMEQMIQGTGQKTDGIKDELRKQCGRDIFALRAINPALTARPGVIENDSRELNKSVVSVAKAVQNLVNGFPVGGSKNESPQEIDDAGEELDMQDRWADGFEKFLTAASARANTTNVANAIADAPQLIETNNRLTAEIDKLNGKSPPVASAS